MVDVIALGIVLAIFLFQLYRAGKNKDGFIKYFSRGAYMRELNKKMGKSASAKK